MKVLCLAVCENGKPPKILAAEHDLSSFSFFTRGSIQEAMNFFVVTVVDRTSQGTRATVQQEQYVGHVYVRQDGLAGAIVTDQEYPQRVAFSVVAKMLDEFSAKFPPNKRSGLLPANTSTFYPELKDHLVKSQDPKSQDPFMRVQRELDETKVVLHKTMESLLQRGEKLDDLVSKSDQLSAQSKMFYKQAAKTNACCTYL
ncbi:Longin-like domain-containing protein [Gorgonomyces haynaldii]|nr:Longin-like domain-containing protein [Gorgonomyces haynaldii]